MTAWYVHRTHTGGLGVSRRPSDETVATFYERQDALDYIERANGFTGWQRELAVATEQARAA